MGHYIWNSRKSRVEYHSDLVDKAGDAFTKGLGSGLDMTSNVLGFFVKWGVILFLIGVALNILYIVAADLILGQLGIVKAKTPVSVSVSESIMLENANIMTVSHGKKPDVELASVVDGQATAKTSTRSQSFYLSYDGMLADGGRYFNPSIVEPVSAAAEFETKRVLVITFLDGDGSNLHANSVTSGAYGGGTVEGAILDDGRLFLLLPEDSQGLTLTFRRDGAEAVELALDWNQYRTGELEVRFRGQ